MHRPKLPLFLAALALMAPALVPAASSAGEEVSFFVVREHGVGSAAQAQKYLVKVVDAAAEVNGWSSNTARYFTSRSAAKSTIASAHYGILSLGAFLALRSTHKFRVVGKAEVRGAGGRQYRIVSKDETTLAGCKGKPLASNHATDAKFIERVVAGRKFKLSDFNLQVTRRPLQTVKKVTRGEASCALIDDAQFADLKNVEGGKDLKTVWTSGKLPPMVVVALPRASDPKGFRAKLAQVCKGARKKACNGAGIRALVPASEGAYKKVIAAYGG